MDLLPISALQHLLFCERQCALIHLEQEWAENRLTAEGRVLHDRAHDGPPESRPGIRIARGLPLVSHRLGLSGQADVVEFHSGNLKSQISDFKSATVFPVEYKRGKPKAHRADEVQLAAQALCLEEMLGIEIAEGSLFYGQPRRRTVVQIDTEMRELVASTSTRLHDIIAAAELPPARYEKRKCDACSLSAICQPRANRSASAWLENEISNLKSRI